MVRKKIKHVGKYVRSGLTWLDDAANIFLENISVDIAKAMTEVLLLIGRMIITQLFIIWTDLYSRFNILGSRE